MATLNSVDDACVYVKTLSSTCIHMRLYGQIPICKHVAHLCLCFIFYLHLQQSYGDDIFSLAASTSQRKYAIIFSGAAA